MVDPDLTRRRLLQAGAGVLAAAAVGRVALPGSASAGSRVYWPAYAGRLPHEVRLFAGKFVPKGYKEAPFAGRALMGSGKVPGGPDRDLDDRGDGVARRDSDGGAATLALTYLVIDDEEPDEAYDLLLGEVRAFPFTFVPRGWIPCDGRKLEIKPHVALYTLLGPTFPTDDRTWFCLPDLRDRTPIAAGDPDGVPDAPLGSERGDLAGPGEGRQPRLHLNLCICAAGDYPARP
jgi:hypothetical protein